MAAKLKGWRTVIFNLIMAAVMLAVQLGWIDTAPSGDDVNIFLDNLEASLIGLWGAGNIVLRAVTNTPIGKK